MKRNRLLSAALALSLACGPFAALPAVAADPLSVFRDITDPVVAEQCEFLRLLGVVNGKEDGTYFDPAGTFSRAEFVKMAICALDKADEEPAQRNRTIYQDVGSTFWARGYINLASVTKLGEGDSATPLVMGTGDGSFHPGKAITYGEAVTILCRMLGYGASDAATGGAWYEGYLSLGQTAGLTEGLALAGGDVITRAQAAALFYNLYFATVKGSEKTYLVTRGGGEMENAVVLDTAATADDGTEGCFQTTKDTYKTDRVWDASLEGREGKAILDKDGKLLSFQVKSGTSERAVTVEQAKSGQIVTMDGQKYTMEDDTVVYREGKATTWSAVYSKVNDASPTPAVLHYGANGKLAYVYFSAAPVDEKSTVLVARTVPRKGANPFLTMADGGSFRMYKNGVEAAAEDIRQYDVATWEPDTRTIQVCDLKLTGVYETASPSPSDPAKATILGHEFPVLPEARDDLAAFRIGDRITLLLTVNNEIAGVLSEDALQVTAVGLASVSDTAATVKLLQGGLEVKGGTYSGAAERYNGQLVTVTNSAVGKLSMTPLSGSAVKGDWDVSASLLGDRPIARNVKIYDRVPKGTLVEVDYDQLPATIGKDSISFALYDYAGRATCVVLDDATGDAYTYGYIQYTSAVEDKTVYEKNPDGSTRYENGQPVVDLDKSREYRAATLCVRYADAEGGETTSQKVNYLDFIRNDVPGGIAYTFDGKVAATVLLQSMTGVSRSAFDIDEMTVTVAGVIYPVSSRVQVYNKTTDAWLKPGKEGVEKARFYSDDLTLYYDRSPAEGGKIRMIVIP